MANPRRRTRRTRALRYFGAGGWPVGLPETIVRATAKASATASLALASVVLALGVGPTGFPKQVSERCKAGGSWTPTAMANPRRRTRALRYFGAGGWPVGLPETIFRAKLPRQPWQTRAVARARSVILALGAGPSGFPKQFSGRRPKLLRQPPSRSLPLFWRWGLARRASRNKFPSDAKRGDLGRRQPWQTRAVARARSVLSALGAGPSGFSKQLSGRRPKLPRQPWQIRAVALFWRWGLARRASRNNFPGDGQSFCDSLPRARFRRFGAGGWPDGLPETSFRAMQSGGILDADSHGKPAPSHARAPLFRRWGLARRASGNNLPGEASATAMANPRRGSRMLLGAGPSGFPKQVSERRKAGGSWRPPRHMRPEAYVATRAAQIFKGEGQASGRNGSFINQKRTNGQISSFGLRMADFILSRIRSLSAARIKFYQQYQGQGPGSGRNGRFIKQKRPNCQIS